MSPQSRYAQLTVVCPLPPAASVLNYSRRRYLSILKYFGSVKYQSQHLGRMERLCVAWSAGVARPHPPPTVPFHRDSGRLFPLFFSFFHASIIQPDYCKLKIAPPSWGILGQGLEKSWHLLGVVLIELGPYIVCVKCAVPHTPLPAFVCQRRSLKFRPALDYHRAIGLDRGRLTHNPLHLGSPSRWRRSCSTPRRCWTSPSCQNPTPRPERRRR